MCSEEDKCTVGDSWGERKNKLSECGLKSLCMDVNAWKYKHWRSHCKFMRDRGCAEYFTAVLWESSLDFLDVSCQLNIAVRENPQNSDKSYAMLSTK